MSEIREGTVKKGGQNPKPTTPRPPAPQGQRPVSLNTGLTVTRQSYCPTCGGFHGDLTGVWPGSPVTTTASTEPYWDRGPEYSKVIP